MGDILTSVADGVLNWLVETAAGMIGMILGWILDSPDGLLDAPAMRGMIDQALTVGRYLLPLMLLLGVIQAGMAASPGAVARLAFLDMPLVAGAMVVIAPATGVLLAATDALTAWIIDEAAVTSMRSAFTSLPAAPFLSSAGTQPVAGVLALIALIGAFLVWGMMLMRNLGVAVSVLVGPAMLATRLWPAARPWAGRWASLLAVLIVVKPVIGLVLSLSWVMVASGVDPAEGFVDIQALAMGLVAFLAAALVPSFLFKFVPQVGDVVAGRLSSGLGGVAATGVGLATTAAFAARNLPALRGGAAVPISPAGRIPAPAPPPPPPPPAAAPSPPVPPDGGQR